MANKKEQLWFLALAAALLVLVLVGVSLNRNAKRGQQPASVPQGPEHSRSDRHEALSERAGMARPSRNSADPAHALPEDADPMAELEQNGPAVANAVVHTLVPAGHSLVTGGYRTKDGKREYAIVTPMPFGGPSSGQISLSTRMISLDDAAVAKTGLGSLATEEKKTSQNGEVWSQEDVNKTLGSPEPGTETISTPTVVIQAGQQGTIALTGGQGIRFSMQLEASPSADGGFELKSDLKRLEGAEQGKP